MKKLSLILVVNLTVALSPAAWAQAENQTSRQISLVDCVQQALEHNLSLQIERYNPKLRTLDLAGYSGAYDPSLYFDGRHRYGRSGGGLNPTTQLISPSYISDADIFQSTFGGVLPWGLDYSLYGNLTEAHGTSGGTAFDNTSGEVGFRLTQPVLKDFWIDLTRLRIAVAKITLHQSELTLRSKIMDVVTSVEKAYYELVGARETVKVQEKALQLAEQLLAENKKRVEVGTMAPLDEKQAESRVASSRADLLSAQQTLAAAQNAMKSLISDNYREIHRTELEPTETLNAPLQDFNVQESWTRGLALRPDFLFAKLSLESQGYQVKYDRNQLFPQLNLIGGYAHSAGGAATREFSDAFEEFQRGNQPSHYFGASLRIPLSNRTARNAYKSSKMEKERLTLELRHLEQTILSAIDNYVIAAKTSYERVNARRQARLYAEAALDAEQKKLQNGKSTSFVVLQLQSELTAARSGEISALADYNKSLADLALGEGSTLERRKIDLEVK